MMHAHFFIINRFLVKKKTFPNRKKEKSSVDSKINILALDIKNFVLFLYVMIKKDQRSTSQ